MTNSSLTGATYPLVISNKEFQASALTLKDYEEIDNYIQAKIIDIARRQLAGMIAEERTELLQAAIKAASSSGWGTPEGAKFLNTIEGSIRLGWQMIKGKHAISFEAFLKLAKSEGQDVLIRNLESIDIAFGQLNLNADEGSKGEPSEDTKS